MRHYGWRPDTPDIRDHAFRVERPFALPPIMDLRPHCNAVEDQGALGSCTGHAIASAVEFAITAEKRAKVQVSRLFIYWQERKMEGTVNVDAGAQIRNGIKACAKIGAPLERYWPYDVSRWKDEPGKRAYGNAPKQKITEYMRLRGLQDVKRSLAQGYPVVFGFSVYESFESDEVARTGFAPMPKHERLLGGHAVLAVGYDDGISSLIVRNSWGKAWGLGGYFFLPYGYIENPDLSDDFWTVRQ